MLDLQENVERIHIRRGQIEGSHPVIIPPDSLLKEKLLFQAHKNLAWGSSINHDKSYIKLLDTYT